MEGLWEIRYISVWRSVLLVVHKLLKDEEEDLGNVFQEFEFLMLLSLEEWESGPRRAVAVRWYLEELCCVLSDGYLA